MRLQSSPPHADCSTPKGLPSNETIVSASQCLPLPKFKVDCGGVGQPCCPILGDILTDKGGKLPFTPCQVSCDYITHMPNGEERFRCSPWVACLTNQSALVLPAGQHGLRIQRDTGRNAALCGKPAQLR